jgi:tripartite-type tricarboxylate transporter receptor subunit TctC
MLVAPAGTPRPILDKLHAEAKAIAASPEITARVRDGGMLPMDNPSIEGLQAFVRAEIARWAKVVAQAGLTGSQ